MKNITEKLFRILIPLLFTFPLFKENVSSFFFILLAANTVCYSITTKNYKDFNFKRALLLSIPFWIIVVSSVLRGSLIDNFKDINHAFFFLLFPLIFGLIPTVYFTNKRILLYVSILKNACIIVCFGFIITYFFYHSFEEFFQVTYNVSSFRNFVYFEIPFFKIHPTYFTAIMIFCIANSFENVIKDKKWHEFAYIAVFIILTFLLLVKINMLFIIIFVPAMIFFRSNLASKIKVLATVVVSGIMALFIALAPGIKNRFLEFYDSIGKPPVGLAHDSTNIRVAILNCSTEIAKEHYLFGVDFVNLPSVLHSCFEANYDSEFYKDHYYLTHNYFAYIFLSTGILGLLLLLFYTYNVIVILRKINLFIVYVMAVNVFLICFTEDYFYRQFGLFYFCLILFSFMKHREYLDSEEKRIH